MLLIPSRTCIRESLLSCVTSYDFATIASSLTVSGDAVRANGLDDLFSTQ
jgi:hypothetical protein